VNPFRDSCSVRGSLQNATLNHQLGGAPVSDLELQRPGLFRTEYEATTLREISASGKAKYQPEVVVLFRRNARGGHD